MINAKSRARGNMFTHANCPLFNVSNVVYVVVFSLTSGISGSISGLSYLGLSVDSKLFWSGILPSAKANMLISIAIR